MHRSLRLAAAALLIPVPLLGLARESRAAPLVWEGTLTLTLADFPPVAVALPGVSTVYGTSGGSHLDSIVVTASFMTHTSTTVPVTDPETTQDNGIVAIKMTITDLGPGTLGGISAGAPLSPNQLPVSGLVRLCLISPDCTDSLGTNLIQPTTGSGIEGVGVGGLLTIGADGEIQVSIQANPWTLGMASAIDHSESGAYVTLFSTGFARGPASNTSSTAQPGGEVKFVTPMQVNTNLTAGTAKKMSLFLSLHLVPEPGMLLLLLSGVLGLVLLGRQRIRR